MKKLLALLLAFILCFSIFTPFSAAAPSIFNDISGHWAENTIESFFHENIISGFPGGSFKPDQPVTRAELARIVALSFNLSEEVPFEFPDVCSERWYYEYLRVTSHFIPNHHFSGFAGGTNASRSDVTETLVRIKMYISGIAIDMPTPEYVQEYVRVRFNDIDFQVGDINFPNVVRLFNFTWLASNFGIIEGDPTGYFRPSWGVTRAELLVMVDRVRNALDGDDKITVYIPRELFFTGQAPEDSFIALFKESGGVVAELSEDRHTFWRNYPENAGIAYIEVSFAYSDLRAMRSKIEAILQANLEAIIEGFDSILKIEKEICETYTRFVFIVDFEEFMDEWSPLIGDRSIILLLDFTFPYLGQLEYMRRIFYLYNMADLEKIVFYTQDYETLERMEIYSFLHDAPLGLSMRHNIHITYP